MYTLSFLGTNLVPKSCVVYKKSFLLKTNIQKLSQAKFNSCVSLAFILQKNISCDKRNTYYILLKEEFSRSSQLISLKWSLSDLTVTCTESDNNSETKFFFLDKRTLSNKMPFADMILQISDISGLKCDTGMMRILKVIFNWFEY